MPTNMKKARESAGMSQKQVAIEMKVSAPTVSDWEAGKIFPNAEKLSRLSNLYKCSSDYLLGLTNEPSRMEVGEKGEIMIKTNKPISILAARYNLPADVLATITGTSKNTAEAWVLGTASPSGSELESISAFFGLDLNELKAGNIPLSMSEETREKVQLARGYRFAAYRNDKNMTPAQIKEIEHYIEFIRQKGSNDTPEDC